MKYYEDYENGETKRLGSFSLTEDEIVEFAEKYDPLWLHVEDHSHEHDSRETSLGEGARPWIREG